MVKFVGVYGAYQARVDPGWQGKGAGVVAKHAHPAVIVTYQQVQVAVGVPICQGGGGVAAQVQRAGVIGGARPDGVCGCAQVAVGPDGAILPAQEHVQVAVLVQVGEGGGQPATLFADVGILVCDQGPGGCRRGAVVAPVADGAPGADEEVKIAVVVHVGQGRQGQPAHAAAQVVVGDEHPDGLFTAADVAVEGDAAGVVADEEVIVPIGVYVGEGWRRIASHVNAGVLAGHEAPGRGGRRADVAEEGDATVAGAGQEILVTIVVNIHEGW